MRSSGSGSAAAYDIGRPTLYIVPARKLDPRGCSADASKGVQSYVITAKNFWLWFGGIWAAVGAVFLVVGIAVGISAAQITERLTQSGREIEGLVLTKEVSGSDNGAYRVTFRFVDETGQNHRGAAELDPTAWDALTEQGPIRLTYLPQSPRTFRVRDQRDPAAVVSWVFGLVGVALTGVGSFVVVTARRKTKREAALLKHGSRAAATVLDVAPGAVRINGIPQWTLRYRYSDFRGQPHEGSCALSPDEAQSWQPGQAGNVRYDTQSPRSHVWTGRGA